MGPLVSRWYESVAVLIAKLVGSGATLTEAREAFDRIATAVLPMLNDREIAFLRKAAEAEFRRVRSGGKLGAVFGLKRLEKAANAMDRRLQAKAKAIAINDALRQPCVFYCVSTHQKPRCSHAHMQGQILYDTHYRQKLTWWKAKAVEAYIRSADLMSVQEAVRGPTWLITANYCRHRLIPLDTDEVLNGTARTVWLDHAHRSKTDRQRAKEYRDRRRRIAARIKKKTGK